MSIRFPDARQRFRRTCHVAAAFMLFASAILGAGHVHPAEGPATADAGPKSAVAEVPDAEKFFQAVVKVHARAVPEARSAATLGQEREGTGVVIGDDGLILTIGYLIVEADDVSIVDSRGRTLPARVVGYDHPTGLGLVRAVVPLDAAADAAGRIGQARRADPGDDRQR